MPPEWIPFDPDKGLNQELPEARRYVLLQIEEDKLVGMPPRVVVGYRKDHADRIRTPYFIHPGCNFETNRERGGYYHSRVTHWCDMLGDDWFCPLWKGKQEPRGKT